jgi:hypothetical protein
MSRITLQISCLFFLVCSLGPFVFADDTEEGFISIFNGDNMDGWTGAVGGEGYSAEDGMLVCVQGGNIYTDKDYDDFIYRLEFRIPEGANNGVGIRVPEGEHASSQGMEIQILDDYAEKFSNLKPWQFSGAVYGIVPPKRGFLKEAGEWNTMEIHCEGREIRITLNDEVVVDANLDDHLPPMDGYERPGAERADGRLSFCGHGARIEYRNLRVKELSEEASLERSNDSP